MTAADFSHMRQGMLAQIAALTISDSVPLGKAALDRRVMEALAKVPRHEFVPLELQSVAYFDGPLPIGFGKTISQPFIVAVMTNLLDLRPSDIVLEIGTGLGYQADVLAQLAQRVYNVELIEELAVQTRRRLAQQAYTNIEIRVGTGCAGWPEQAPFDRIIVTAAPELIPVAGAARSVGVGRQDGRAGRPVRRAATPAGGEGQRRRAVDARNLAGLVLAARRRGGRLRLAVGVPDE